MRAFSEFALARKKLLNDSFRPNSLAVEGMVLYAVAWGFAFSKNEKRIRKKTTIMAMRKKKQYKKERMREREKKKKKRKERRKKRKKEERKKERKKKEREGGGARLKSMQRAYSWLEEIIVTTRII